MNKLACSPLAYRKCPGSARGGELVGIAAIALIQHEWPYMPFSMGRAQLMTSGHSRTHKAVLGSRAEQVEMGSAAALGGILAAVLSAWVAG